MDFDETGMPVSTEVAQQQQEKPARVYEISDESFEPTEALKSLGIEELPITQAAPTTGVEQLKAIVAGETTPDLAPVDPIVATEPQTAAEVTTTHELNAADTIASTEPTNLWQVPVADWQSSAILGSAEEPSYQITPEYQPAAQTIAGRWDTPEADLSGLISTAEPEHHQVQPPIEHSNPTIEGPGYVLVNHDQAKEQTSWPAEEEQYVQSSWPTEHLRHDGYRQPSEPLYSATAQHTPHFVVDPEGHALPPSHLDANQEYHYGASQQAHHSTLPVVVLDGVAVEPPPMLPRGIRESLHHEEVEPTISDSTEGYLGQASVSSTQRWDYNPAAVAAERQLRTQQPVVTPQQENTTALQHPSDQWISPRLPAEQHSVTSQPQEQSPVNSAWQLPEIISPQELQPQEPTVTEPTYSPIDRFAIDFPRRLEVLRDAAQEQLWMTVMDLSRAMARDAKALNLVAVAELAKAIDFAASTGSNDVVAYIRALEALAVRLPQPIDSM
jgi:hypothetical protein